MSLKDRFRFNGFPVSVEGAADLEYAIEGWGGLEDQYELRALHLPPELKIRESYGCEVCEGSGHLGRVGAYEMFPLHGEFRDIALSNLSPQQKQQHLEQLLHKVQLPSLAARMRMHVVEGTVAPHAALAALGLLRGTKRAA